MAQNQEPKPKEKGNAPLIVLGFLATTVFSPFLGEIAKDVKAQLALPTWVYIIIISAVFMIAITAFVVSRVVERKKLLWRDILVSVIEWISIIFTVFYSISLFYLALFIYGIDNIFRIICSAFSTIIAIEYTLVISEFPSLAKKALVYFIIALLFISSLSFTYVSCACSYPINMVAKLVIDKPVVDEVYYYDRGFLGMYKTTGQGKYLYANGTIYEGEFVDGTINGAGRETFTDGWVFEGQYVNGNRHGVFTITYPGGSTGTMTFE